MNYYEILGVTPDSDIVEIKSAYRKLARKFHPDVNPDGVRRFKEISKAYATLSDEEKRKQYDMINGFFKSSPKQEQEKPKEEFSRNKSDNNEKKADDKEPKKTTKKNEKIFSDLFNTIFETQNEQKQNKPQPQNGDDINTDVTVSIAEAVTGTSKTVNVMHSELCPRCKGRKFINGNKCSVCNGSGEYSQFKRINVKIPANVKNGAKLRIKGEGGEGKFGGKNGDLYLFIQIQGNSKIKYDEENILYNVPITPYEAVLGGEITVPTFDGHVKLKIPARTTSGQKFRLAGQGLKKNGKVGDMIVTVTIEIPKRLSDDEVKLYEKLKKLSADDIRENLLND